MPPGMPINVAGHTIPGGLLYVGQHLRSGVGAIEPALINPLLPVDRQAPDHQSPDHQNPARPIRGTAPAPSYHLVSSATRAEYLAWLAGGRRRVNVPIGLVLLFFSGLERRVLLDSATDASVQAELPLIATEVRRLRAAHGPASRDFDSCAGAFLEVLELLGTTPAHPTQPPAAPSADRWPVPLALRIALAQFAVAGRAIPADWARCWAWYLPSLIPSTPQIRCPDQFDALFALRYRTRFPPGLRPSTTDRPPIRIGYRPANPGIDTTVVDRVDLPDVLEETTSARELSALVDSVTQALTPYSRWLARNPRGAGSIASTRLLPTDLLDHDPGPLRPLLSWANSRLAGRVSALVNGRDFAPFWSTADPARMTKEESEGLSIVLARIGLGMEPDVRFGGVPLGPGPVVLFRLVSQASERPSPGYTAAMTLLSVAAATVLSRVEPIDDPGDGVNATIVALASEVQLTVSERSRLSARLRWLLASSASPASTTAAQASALRRRIDALTEAEREAAGYFLISAALAVSNNQALSNHQGLSNLPAASSNQPVRRATVSALTTAYRLVGLPEDLLFRRLHQQALDEGDTPVVVRRRRLRTTGHLLPFATSGATTPPTPEADSPIRLRQSVVNRTMARTEEAYALLTGIFVEDDIATDAEPARVNSTPDRGLATGLDQVHDSLLRELTTRSSWSRADLAKVASKHGVLPDGALDVINEVAVEITGEPVIEGDDELSVNDAVLREILA